MCDFCSWMEKGNKVYFLTDDIIEAAWGVTLPKVVQNYIGHGAIERYFGKRVRDIKHEEGVLKVPRPIARAINNGEMRRMMESSDPSYRNLRYSQKGNLISINGLTFREFREKYEETTRKLKQCPIEYDTMNFYGLKEGDRVIIGPHMNGSLEEELTTTDKLKKEWVRQGMRVSMGYPIVINSKWRKNWNSIMEKYVGKIATITTIGKFDVSSYGICKLDIDRGNWSWHCGALKKVEE